MTASRASHAGCAVLLGFDPDTAAATAPVGAACWSGIDLAVSWLPLTDGLDRGWRDALAAPAAGEWGTILVSAAASPLLDLGDVQRPSAADDLQDAAEQLLDVLLSPAAGTSAAGP